MSLSCISWEEKAIRIYVTWVNLVFSMYIVSLMCQIINILGKIAAENAGSVFAYFCGGHKIIFHYNFIAPLKTTMFIKFII